MSHTHTTASGLRQRGWTEKAVANWLGKPDMLRTNPHYKSGPEMRLYDLQRVIKVEATEEWQSWQASRQSTRDAAARAVETKRDRLLDYVAELEVTVPFFAKDELVRRACDHYNDRNYLSDKFLASSTSDEAFLSRICVNYLRHELTCYETELDRIYGKVGVHDARNILRIRIYKAIKKKYGWLRIPLM